MQIDLHPSQWISNTRDDPAPGAKEPLRVRVLCGLIDVAAWVVMIGGGIALKVVAFGLGHHSF